MSFRTMLSCLVLLYALICIPVYIMSLMHAFSGIILFNLGLMILLAGLIVHDLFQDHEPFKMFIEMVRDPDPDVDGLGEE